MFDFAREIDRDEQAELERLFARQKLIMGLSPSKVVLAHDFFSAVRIPHADRPHDFFAKAFGSNAEWIGKSLNSLVKAKKARTKLVPYEELRGEARSSVFKVVREHVDERIGAAKTQGKPVDFFEEYPESNFSKISEDDFSEDGRAKRIDEFAALFNMTAYRLKDIVKAMDTYSFSLPARIPTRLLMYQKGAVRQGEGREVVKLWERVNNLHDYGYLFSGEEPPKGTHQKNLAFNGGRRPGVVIWA